MAVKRIILFTAGAVAIGLVARRVVVSRQPSTRELEGPRWRSVTIARSEGTIAPDGMLPQPLLMLGDLIDIKMERAPGDRGTELSARLRAPEPTGVAGLLQRVRGTDPRQAVRRALRESETAHRGGRNHSRRTTTSRSSAGNARRRGCRSPCAPLVRRGRAVKALCWTGINQLTIESVAEPTILNPRDAIVKVLSTVTCGSDLHLIGGYIPGVRVGDILGHEFMGEIVEIGSAVTERKVGDRVVVCSFISCGECWYCRNNLTSLCDNTNPSPGLGGSRLRCIDRWLLRPTPASPAASREATRNTSECHTSTAARSWSPTD